MILDEYLDIRMISNQITYYRNKGYSPVKVGDIIKVKIDDIPQNSNRKIHVKCDMCGNEKEINIQSYYKSFNNRGYYCCNKCGKNKYNEVMMEKYGVIVPYKNKTIKDKGKATLIKKYGVDNPMLISGIADKIKETNLQKYGYEYVLQSPEIRKKIKETIFVNWGVENSMMSPIVQEKAKKTMINIYGVDNCMKNEQIREKAVQTMCDNNHQCTSLQQKYLYNLFENHYNVILNSPIKYYSMDIYFPDYKLDFEYNGGGHDLKVVLGVLSKEDFIKKERKRSFVVASQGINQLTIISRQDYLPSDNILLKMLQETLSYFSSTNHHWQEYDIDNQTLRNATGIYPYDFGDLRKIKKSDLNNKLNTNHEITKEAS